MIRKEPLSTRAKWAIVLAAVASHPVLLYALYPVVGEVINTIVLAGPVAATLLFGIRVGAVFIAVSSALAAFVFSLRTGMRLLDGVPKAGISALVTATVCMGADRLRRFIEQRKAVEEALHQAQKMEAIGRLAGGVAHDINNTLNAIMGSAFALRHELAAYGRYFPDLENIALACDRGAQLTRNLLGFARKNCQQEEAFSLNAVVQRVHALLGRTLHEGMRFEMQLAEPSPRMVGDQGQIESALMNLCLNAIDAMEGGGTLTMATASDTHSVSVRVSDTGTGMDDYVREHAFEPFFTTKPAGKGTGMGLPMVYGTVHAMHGDITIESALGRGTSFTMTFPPAPADRADQSRVSIPVPVADDLQFLKGRTVLLIDDEPLVLRAGGRMLRTLGCEVLSAKSGAEAIELLKGQNFIVSLAVIDLIMPDADGVATLDQIRALAPQTPILLASGYPRESARLEAVLSDRPDIGFVAKPYDAAVLIKAAKKLLGPRAEPKAPASKPMAG